MSASKFPLPYGLSFVSIFFFNFDRQRELIWIWRRRIDSTLTIDVLFFFVFCFLRRPAPPRKSAYSAIYVFVLLLNSLFLSSSLWFLLNGIWLFWVLGFSLPGFFPIFLLFLIVNPYLGQCPNLYAIDS